VINTTVKIDPVKYIPVRASTRDRIKTYGHQGDTYDKTINRVMNDWIAQDAMITELYRERDASKIKGGVEKVG
jgi:hypothetical protein